MKNLFIIFLLSAISYQLSAQVDFKRSSSSIRTNDANSEHVNLRWFAPAGTTLGLGVASYVADSTALTNAIAYLAAKGGGSLYVPSTPFFYGFNGNPIVLPDNIEIFGDGPATEIKHVNPESGTVQRGAIFATGTYGPTDSSSIFKSGDPRYHFYPADSGSQYIVLTNAAEASNLSVGEVVVLGARQFLKQAQSNKHRALETEAVEVFRKNIDTVWLRYSLTSSYHADTANPVVFEVNSGLTTANLGVPDHFSKNISIHDMTLAQADRNMIDNLPYSGAKVPNNLIAFGATYGSKFYNLQLLGFGTFGGNMYNRCDVYNLTIGSAKKMFDFGYGSANVNVNDIKWIYQTYITDTALRAFVYLDDGSHDIDIGNIHVRGKWRGNNVIQMAGGPYNITIHDVSFELPEYNSTSNNIFNIDDDNSDIYPHDITFRNFSCIVDSVGRFINMTGVPAVPVARNIVFDKVTFGGVATESTSVNLQNTGNVILRDVTIPSGDTIAGKRIQTAQFIRVNAPTLVLDATLLSGGEVSVQNCNLESSNVAATVIVPPSAIPTILRDGQVYSTSTHLYGVFGGTSLQLDNGIGTVTSVTGTTNRITVTGTTTPVIDIASAYDALFVKRDGTTGLSGDWNVGSFYIKNKANIIGGSAGAGYLELENQSSAVAAPSSANAVRLWSDGGALAWTKQSDGFERKFVSTLTAARNFTWPDASGTVVFNDNTATLTNKTIGSTQVTFTDVTTGNASSSAHGFLPKLSNVSTEYLSGTGVFSTPVSTGLSTTLADGKIYIGNASNVATAVTPTGDVTITNAGVTAIGASKVTNTMLAGSIAYSKLSLTGAVLNADLASGIDAAKITTGTLPDAQTAALTGNVTKPAGSSVTTIATGVVTNTMLAGGITVANGGTGTTTSTGTTNVVLSNSPTLVTPVLGVATATSINKVALTAPATGSTLTIADGKTLTANNSITIAGTDATTMTFPSTSATIARTDAAQTFTGTQTFGNLAATASAEISAAGTAAFRVGTTNSVFRTTNGGSNISFQSLFDVDNSISTAASQAFGFETANGLVFTTANGTRRIMNAKIKLLSVTTTAGSEAADLGFFTQNAGGVAAERLRITSAGGLTINSTVTTAGTTGAQTINKPSGQVNFAAGVSTLVVTNSLATTSSLIFVQVLGTDVTATNARVTKASGSFTITLIGAATAETAVEFLVIN